MTAPTTSRAMISQEKLLELQGTKDSSVKQNKLIETNEDSGETYLSFLSNKQTIFFSVSINSNSFNREDGVTF